MLTSRREFIKAVSFGAAGISIGATGAVKNIFAKEEAQENNIVSFGNGGDRKKLLLEILAPLEEKIRQDIKGKQVIIKPNCVWDANKLCASDPDAIRAVLDFLKPIYNETVVIAEATASPNGSMKCFEDYEYTKVAKEYNAKLVDLNQDSYTVEWILGKNRYPLDIKIIDTFLNPNNYIISLARMKTHNTVVATLSFKNMIMACPINVAKSHPDFVVNQFEKRKMHEGGAKGINYNMFRMAHKVRPNLAIIDGFIGMEGNGPRNGTPVEHGVALAGFNMVSVDRVGIELMGIKYDDVAYLQWSANAGLGQGSLEKIKILGPDYKKFIRTYKLADNIQEQLQWKNTSDS